MSSERRIDLDNPRWPQNTFLGRFKHFANVTDPRTLFCTTRQLEEAKDLVEKYRGRNEPPGVTDEKLWHAKKLYDSSFHPDSGELQNLMGRMSFQVPGGMLITGFMMQFYRTNTAVIFWQWINQSFNALVNYTNRNAKSDIKPRQITVAYVSATTSAVVTAICLKAFLAKRSGPLLQRLVPFAAVAAANCANIPLMRQSELAKGITVFDEDGRNVTESKFAAVKGISQVTASRITMAAPGMILTPFIMERLEKFPWMNKIKVLHAPLQVTIVGTVLLLMVPTACAIFPQKASITSSELIKWEPEKRSDLEVLFPERFPDKLYFNKGL